MLGVDVDDAGVHHNADAELGVPQNRVGVVHKERAADDVNRRIDVVYLGCLLTARELALDDHLGVVAHDLEHIEPRIAAGLADAENDLQVLALLRLGKGVLNVLLGAQGAGDVQINHSIVLFAGAGLHAGKAVLVDLDLRHAVSAQLGPAGQVDDLRVLGGHQSGQVLAVGVQRNVDFQLRVLFNEQLRGAQRIVNQRFAAEIFQVLVFKALAAGTAANCNEQSFHCTFSPKVSFSTFSASAGGLQLSPLPVSA